MKLTLKQMIINVIEQSPRGYAEELAKIAGYANGSGLKKVLKDEKKEFEKVNGLFKIVQTHFPQDEIKLISDFALTLDFNKHTARCMLEFAEMNRLVDIRQTLVANMLESTNLMSKQWATIHEIDMSLTNKEITYLEALSLLENVSSKSPELTAIKAIYKAYCYLEVQLFDSVRELLTGIEALASEMKDDYMKEVILSKYYLLMTESSARKGNIDLARSYATKLTKEITIPLYVAWGNLHLGNSYLLEDYNKANHHLIKGKMTANNNSNLLTNIKRSLNFLDNVWKKEPRELDINSQHPADVHEIAFYYINHNQLTMAKKTLDSENVDNLTSNQKGFHFYLRGLMSNNMVDHCESIKYFKESGDIHFRQLPLIELKKLNVQECIIQALAV